MYSETSDELELNEYYFRRSKDGPIFDKRFREQNRKVAAAAINYKEFSNDLKYMEKRSENGEFSRF